MTDYALEKFGFKDCIDFVVTRESNETIFIGDSWLDAEAGFRAGIHYAHFGTEQPPKSRKGDFNIEHSLSTISDIIELMNKIDESWL